MEGAEWVMSTLKRLGYKIGIISGGFDYFGYHLQQKLGVDYVYANRLEIVDGQLTGTCAGEIIDGPRKPSCCNALPSLKMWSWSRLLPVAMAQMIFPC